MQQELTPASTSEEKIVESGPEEDIYKQIEEAKEAETKTMEDEAKAIEDKTITTEVETIHELIDIKVIDNLDPFTYITEEILEYEPCQKDLFIYHKKSGDYQRLIWGDPQELRERETDRMEEFLEYVKEKGLEPVPEFYFGPDRMGYRFLQGNHWKYDKTAVAIQDHYKWHQGVYPVDGTKTLPFLQSGAVYI